MARAKKVSDGPLRRAAGPAGRVTALPKRHLGGGRNVAGKPAEWNHDVANAEVRRLDPPVPVTPFLRCLLRAGRPEFLVELGAAALPPRRKAAGF